MGYPEYYRWYWKCYNCNVTWPCDLELKKSNGFTWCPTCGCHLVSKTDIKKMKEEGNWKGGEQHLHGKK
jgi:hypothetical protein